MALVLGTNCGFVTTAPTEDPAGSTSFADDRTWSIKNTSPVGNYKIVEMGWYASSASEETNFEMGLYDSSRNLLSVSRTNAKGTTAGWKKVTGLNIPIDSETIYWIAVQIDITTTGTFTDAISSGGEGYELAISQTTLLDPLVNYTATDSNGMVAIYALVEEASSSEQNSILTLIAGGGKK